MDWKCWDIWKDLGRSSELKHEITLDKKGICIDGSYRILLISSLFYFRIPVSKWDERMKELKSAGYNGIDVYFPWNYHETAPGEWNFEENRDVELFLDMARENELWVIARPGPYICSEWDGGAIPAWHTLKDFKIRQNDEAYIRELARWYEKILPVIGKHQWKDGGPVILLQIENELDYFLCEQPAGYVGRLAEIAVKSGIEVPMIVCCGQDDIEKSGGKAPGIKTAFNIYGVSDSRGLEERTFRLYEEMQVREQPLMVTETNREHSWLKRLLGCGARMLSPYNQTAGTTMDYYNAMTNWGREDAPLALLTSDYDFHSMIGSDGTLRKEEYIQARLLAGFIYSMGEGLACGIPVRRYQDTERTNKTYLTGHAFRTVRGDFYQVSHLGTVGQVKEIRMGDVFFKRYMPPVYTALFPVDLKLSGNCRIEWTNCEVGWIRQEKEIRQAALYGYGVLQMKVRLQDKSVMVIKQIQEKKVGKLVLGGWEFLYGEPEQIARERIPGLDPWCLEETNRHQELRVEKVLAIPWRCENICREVPVMEMEKLGQYRGRGSYEFELDSMQKLQISGLTDIVTVFHEGRFWQCLFGDGREQIMTLPKGKWQFWTEIWGHCNFEDIRVESLRLGSLKGIRKICRILQEEDISENWEFGESRDAYRFLTDIDKYNIPRSPVVGFYRKKLCLCPDCKEFSLLFSRAECRIHVWINGCDAGLVRESNPCINITPWVGDGGECVIELEVCRHNYARPVGKITLSGGERLKRCTYRDITFTGMEEKPENKEGLRIRREGEWEEILPLYVSPEEELIIIPQIPKQGCADVKLFLEGKNILVTVVCSGHVAGRHILGCSHMPPMAGGAPGEVFLCREWLEKSPVVMKCQALSRDACLERISLSLNIAYDRLVGF
ncbi:beta-galactosidase [Parablautia intestinalis]|uniref:beta-galactosidase n=1 Tax=Parablautia intestinalis TaxID=2320100 RepID=UPI00256E9D7C|nr:beta-galactosidase [Parablautia intestinalis]